MKFILAIIPILALAEAQRPYYAGSRPVGYPELASRFKDTAESTTVDVAARLGGDATTARIPVDARGDQELVDRLNQWPREHRPFWLLNAEQIEASRKVAPTSQPVGARGSFASETIPVRPTEPRSSFLGPLN